VGISERQTPRLLVKVHLPSEPSEKLTVNGQGFRCIKTA
jgi:hypothetical protein